MPSFHEHLVRGVATYALELFEVAIAGEHQGVAIAQLPPRAQRAVLREKRLDLGGAHRPEVGTQPCRP